MGISFFSTKEGKRYLKGLRRRDSLGEFKFSQGWEEGKVEGVIEGATFGAYNSLVITLRRLFKEEPTEIEAILRKKDVQKLMQFLHIAFDCASYEEFIEIVKAEETENYELVTSR